MTDRILQTSVVALAVLASVALVLLPYDTVGGVIVIGAAGALFTLIFLPRLVPAEDRSFLRNILIFALLARIFGASFRLFVNLNLYGGDGDINFFDLIGQGIANQIRAGEFGAAFEGFGVGTPAIQMIVGSIYAVIGTTFYGAFLLSGFMAFLGAVFFYRAFTVAFPSGNRKLFALLIFFYPALLYWPTGLGKDLVVIMAMGIGVWGAVVFIVQSRLLGLWVAVLSISLAFIVRPEIGLIATVSFITAFLLRRPSQNKKAFTIQLIGAPLVLLVGFAMIGSATSFLGIEELSVNAVLDVITEQSSAVFEEGGTGSNFNPPAVGTPTWIPEVFITVLFRPFPWEAHNIAALMQSLDGVLLAGILFITSGRLVRSLRTETQNPMVIASIVFILLAVIAVGTLGNFGLLARQRTIVLPFLFFLIAAARTVRRTQETPPDGVDAPAKTAASPVAASVTG